MLKTIYTMAITALFLAIVSFIGAVIIMTYRGVFINTTQTVKTYLHY